MPSDARSAGDGPFRIGFVTGVTVSKWTRVWADRHPGIPLEVTPTEHDAQLDGIRSRQTDVAFVRLPIDGDGLSVIPLYAERAFVVVPREHPVALFDSVTLADLSDENLIGLPPADAVSVVAADVGVAIMPQSLARLHARKDVVAREVVDAPETRVALAWLAEETTERIEDFIGIVRGRTAQSSRGSRHHRRRQVGTTQASRSSADSEASSALRPVVRRRRACAA